MNILRRPCAVDVLTYLIQFRAATAYELRKEIDFSFQAIYGALNFLIEKGVVVRARPVRAGRRRASVYALYNYSQSDISEAIKRDRIRRTPGFKEAQRISQLILDDYFSQPEPRRPLYTEDDVFPVIRREIRGFRWWDLSDLVLSDLRGAGIQIYYGGRH